MESVLPVPEIPEALLKLCLRYRVVPLSLTDHQLVIAATEPLTLQQESALRFGCNRSIEVTLWPSAKFESVLKNLTRQRSNRMLTDEQPTRLVREEVADYMQEQIQDGDENSIVKFVNQILTLAFKQRASDIHFEPYAEGYRIRFRIDGVLQEIATPPAIAAEQLAARLKILGELNIAERRLPQDGQLTVHLGGENRALRIATLPVLDGEKIVLRVMDADKQPLDIQRLGMPEHLQQRYLRALHSPQGLILVTGPTGSGKTVTLYSGLNVLNHTSRNICSIEDPVEIPLCGINQTQVNPKIGLVFSRALKAFLRQDPDVIMIGEIRDKETAEIAIQAAQTGHLVLSTIHTNSTVETLTRLNQVGIANYLIVAGLTLVIAQRLVRRLCPHCREQEQETVKIELPYWRGEVANWRAEGCDQCLGGYYGRTAIYEMLPMTPLIKQALLTQNSHDKLETLAVEQGMQTLLMSGIELVGQGVTSLQEVYRVVGDRQESDDICSEQSDGVCENGVASLSMASV